MRSDLVLVSLLCGAVMLAGCSRDTALLSDYKLYDLDGSNQAIIGNGGMVAVINVTALALEKPFIFVEVGGEYSSQKPTGNCTYKVIDTAQNSMTDLLAGTPVHDTALEAIRAQKQGVLSRSCAVRR